MLATRPSALARRLVASCLTALVLTVTQPGAQASQPNLDLAQYRGQVVIVDFWASWCKPCRQSIPWLNQLRARYGSRGLVIIGVNVDAERADADRFLREVPIDFEVVYDSQGALAGQFRLQGMPSTFIFDRAGKLAATHMGFREKQREQHENEIQNLLTGEAR